MWRVLVKAFYYKQDTVGFSIASAATVCSFKLWSNDETLKLMASFKDAYHRVLGLVWDIYEYFVWLANEVCFIDLVISKDYYKRPSTVVCKKVHAGMCFLVELAVQRGVSCGIGRHFWEHGRPDVSWRIPPLMYQLSQLTVYSNRE